MRWRAPQQCDIGASPGQHSGIERAESTRTDNRNPHGRAYLFYVIDHSCTINEVHSYTIMQIRSEEHTSELQSLMRISYAVFCLKKKTTLQTLSIIKLILKQHS